MQIIHNEMLVNYTGVDVLKKMSRLMTGLGVGHKTLLGSLVFTFFQQKPVKSFENVLHGFLWRETAICLLGQFSGDIAG